MGFIRYPNYNSVEAFADTIVTEIKALSKQNP